MILVAKLLQNYQCPSVCLNVRFRGERINQHTIQTINLIFSHPAGCLVAQVGCAGPGCVLEAAAAGGQVEEREWCVEPRLQGRCSPDTQSDDGHNVTMTSIIIIGLP